MYKELRDPIFQSNLVISSPDFLNEISNIDGVTKTRSYVFSTFGINESKDVIRISSETSEPTTLFVYADSFTREAQNSLLKLIEEPNQNIKFVFITRSESNILETLRSRLRVYRIIDDSSSKKTAKDFLSSDISARLKLVEKLSVHPDEDKVTSSKEGLSIFIKDLQSEYRRKGDYDSVKYLSDMCTYLNDKSASHRLILENIAINLS